jgi:hypothetical protein
MEHLALNLRPGRPSHQFGMAFLLKWLPIPWWRGNERTVVVVVVVVVVFNAKGGPAKRAPRTSQRV